MNSGPANQSNLAKAELDLNPRPYLPSRAEFVCLPGSATTDIRSPKLSTFSVISGNKRGIHRGLLYQEISLAFNETVEVIQTL